MHKEMAEIIEHRATHKANAPNISVTTAMGKTQSTDAEFF